MNKTNKTTVALFISSCLVGLLMVVGAVMYKQHKEQAAFDKTEHGQLNKQIETLKTTVKTAKGTTVKSEKPISSELLKAIDVGFDKMELAAAHYKFTTKTDRTAYMVLVFPSVRDYNDEGVYLPVFKTPIDKNNPYAGGQYDKGGYILAAERVINLDAGVFAIAEYKDRFDEAANATLFGTEHILLWHNDRAKFNETAYHLISGHPILPL